MIISHQGKTPRIAASAYVAPNAVLRGDVYGLDRGEVDMVKVTRRVAEALASHARDAVITDQP